MRGGLGLAQLRVLPRRRHQLLMAFHLHHPDAVEDDDEIRHPH